MKQTDQGGRDDSGQNILRLAERRRAKALPDAPLSRQEQHDAGVDPQSRNAIFENLEELKRRGKTLVYTMHYMEEAERLCTIERRWRLASLTARDAAAQDVGPALTLAAPRTDDPLQGVVVPTAKMPASLAHRPSHLQQVQAQLASQLPVPDSKGGTHHELPRLRTNEDYRGYIRRRMSAWLRGRS